MPDFKIGDTKTILKECEEFGLLRNQAAYVLATAYHETAATMKPVVEAYWLSEDWRKNNLRYYPWYGRGYVQLTWEDNYKKAGKELEVDLTTDPSKALDPVIASKVLVVGSAQGWFTGKKLEDYITLKKSDFVNARRIINGTDKAQTVATLAKEYDSQLMALGYGEEGDDPDEGDDDLEESIRDLERRVSKLEGHNDDWEK
jgi:hypothetical protein